MLALRVGRHAAALPSAALHTTAIACAKSRRPRQAAAFEKAKQFAKALGQEPAAGPSSVPWPEAAPAQSLSVDDLVALKPAREPRTSKGNYADKHAALFAAVDNAFVRKQLFVLAQEMQLLPRLNANKNTLIQIILDSWGWIRPKPKEAPLIRMRHILVSTSELFLLQRDESVTAWLGTLEGVSLSVSPDEGNGELQGWILEAKGEVSLLTKLEQFLLKERGSHVVLRWHADAMRGFTPTKATLWNISVATGAHVEPIGWGKYMVTGRNLASAAAAKRLVLTIAARATAPQPVLGICLPPTSAIHETPDLYALSPHVPASSSPLPWDTLAGAGGRPLFRLSLANADNPGIRQGRHRAAKLGIAGVEGLGGSEGGTLSEVVERTLAAVPPLEGTTPRVTFKLGHLLVPTSSDVEHSLQAPIPGAWAVEPTSPWTKLSTPIFSPATPPALVHFPLPAPHRIRRVTYLSQDGSRVSADYFYPKPVEEPSTPTPADEPAWIHRLDAMIAQKDSPAAKNGEASFDFGALRGLIEEDKPVPEHPLQVTARLTHSAVQDMLFPDRPIDARVVGHATESIELPALADFFNQVHEHAHSASEVPLTDLETLRRGRVIEPVQEEESQLVESEEFEGVEWAKPVEEAEEGDEEEEELTLHVKAPEEPDITPPASVEFDSVKYYLERDEVIELSESVAPATPDDTDASGEAIPRPLLRTLAVTDLTGIGGVSRHAELEGQVNSHLWTELASVTREVPSLSQGSQVRM